MNFVGNKSDQQKHKNFPSKVNHVDTNTTAPPTSFTLDQNSTRISWQCIMEISPIPWLITSIVHPPWVISQVQSYVALFLENKCIGYLTQEPKIIWFAFLIYWLQTLVLPTELCIFPMDQSRCHTHGQHPFLMIFHYMMCYAFLP